MHIVRDYEFHARECRKMATEGAPPHRLPIIQMAEMWSTLAADRRKWLAKTASEKKAASDAAALGRGDPSHH